MNSFAYRSTYVPCALHQNFYVHTMFYWLINSRSYYKVQIEIGAAANQEVCIKIACKIQINFMVFNLVLSGDYLRVVTT